MKPAPTYIRSRGHDRIRRLVRRVLALPVGSALILLAFIVILPIAVCAQHAPRLPFTFIENRGQWNADALYLLDRGDMRAWLTAGGVVYDLRGAAGRGHVLRQRFMGSEISIPQGEEEQDGRWSFIGGGAGITARGFTEVRYHSLYQGIDARYYEHEGGLKYDLLVAPGADPSHIRFTYDGAGSISVQPDGALRIGTSVGDVLEAPPYCYQRIGDRMQPVPCRFVIDGRGIGLQPGAYDRSHQLVIDPALIYSSYLGGADPDEGRGLTLDDAGNIYVTGSTRSKKFPTTVGAYRQSIDPVNPEFPLEDIFVAKFDPTGSTLVYGTYINGRGSDRPAGIAVQSNGVAVIAGTTFSIDFETTAGAFDRTTTGVDQGKGFVLGLSANGGRLVFSTYFGGSEGTVIEGLALGRSDHIYIAGWTRSHDLPTTPGVLAESFRGGTEDAFIARFNESGALRASSYLGGSGDERATSIAVEAGGRAWVTGWTTSPDYPTDTLFGAAARGARDCFMTCMLPELTPPFASMLIGGSANEEGRSIAVRERFGQNPLADTVYVTGRTTSPNYPVIPATLPNQRGAWFAVKVITSGRPSTLVYSRYLGNLDDGSGASIQADLQGNAYLAGTVRASRGDFDIRFIRLNPGGDVIHDRQIDARADDTLAHQSFLSGFGDLFVVGTTRSTDFPVTVGAFDTRLNDAGESGSSDAFILRYGFLKRPAIYAPPVRRFDTLRCAGERLDTFLVHNLGDDTLIIRDHNLISGGDAFSIIEPDRAAAPFRIPPGQTIRYIVRYAPTRAGADSARLQIISNDLLPGRNPLEVRYHAVRVLIDPRTSGISFGAAPVCGEGGGGREVQKPLNLLVTPAVRTRIRLQLQGTSGTFRFIGPPEFEIDGSVQLSLSFIPPSAGEHRDTLLIFSIDCPEPLRIPLQGTGQAVRVSLAEQELHFPPLFACLDTVRQSDTFFTVVNDGDLPITVDGVDIIDPGFSRITPLPLEVPPHSSRTIVLRFTSNSGPDTVVGYPVVRIRECSRPLPLPVFGEVRGSGTLNGPPELNFGEITGCPGEPTNVNDIVVVENRGGESIIIDTVIIVGENPPDFRTGDLPSLPMTLAGLESIRLPIIFTPADTGTRDAVLVIPYHSGNCHDTLRVPLLGLHVLEQVEAVDSVIVIPELSQCIASHDTVIALRNRSGRPVTIVRMLFTGGIDITRSRPVPFVIPPDGIITDTVRFAPRQAGAVEESVTYITEICHDSIVVKLRGTRRGVVLDFTLDTLHLPPVLACRTDGVADTIVLRNIGDADGAATIASATVLGSDAFDLVEDPVGRTIAAGEALRIPMRFIPPGAGNYSAMLRVVYEPCDDTVFLSMDALVVEPVLEVRGGNFGEVQVGHSATQRVVIVNTNPVPITLDRLDDLQQPFTLSGGDALPATLVPGDSLELFVDFLPTTAAAYAPTPLIIATEPCGFTVPVSLTGTGIMVADTISFCLESFASGRVGDTVNLRLLPSRLLVLPGNALHHLRFDWRRLQFIDVKGPSGTVLQIVTRDRGLVSFLQPAGAATGTLSLRFRLLAGRDNPAIVHLDSIAISSDTLAARPCTDSARIFISDGCLVTGVQLGAFKNLLEDARPNPAGDRVEITYQQLEDGLATIRIFDAVGREVLRPLDAVMSGGRYTIQFSVAALPAGTYLYRIEAGSYSAAKRLIVRD